MKLSEEAFYRSSIGKVIYLIDKWGQEQRMKAEAMQGHKVAAPPPGAPQSARRIKDILGGLV